VGNSAGWQMNEQPQAAHIEERTMNQEVTAVINLNYHAYLVRIWRDNEQAPWHASTTQVSTGEVQKFADVQMLWRFLQLQLEAPAPTENDCNPS
jgi:hypothetical protein